MVNASAFFISLKLYMEVAEMKPFFPSCEKSSFLFILFSILFFVLSSSTLFEMKYLNLLPKLNESKKRYFYNLLKKKDTNPFKMC